MGGRDSSDWLCCASAEAKEYKVQVSTSSVKPTLCGWENKN